MPEATNAQMQRFADERIRPFSELMRSVRAAAADHKAAIDDPYARATGANQWADARTDGPPHLLQAGNAANPNDVTNFNAFVTLVEKLFAGTFVSLAEANSAAAMWAVLQDACVRPVG